MDNSYEVNKSACKAARDFRAQLICMDPNEKMQIQKESMSSLDKMVEDVEIASRLAD